MNKESTLSLPAFAAVTSASAFFVLFAGGMVTSTGSGLAVPDWPLSFGTYFPRMVGGVFFEHGHRLVAGATALLTGVLAYWVLRVETRKPVRRLAVAAAGAILLQAGLGGLTVLLQLPPAVSIVHACLGQAVFCVLLAIWELTRPRVQGEVQATGKLWKYGALAVGAIYLQLILGALVRHTGMGLAFHALWALGVTAHLASVIIRTFSAAPGRAELTRPATLLLIGLAVQLVLGVSVYALRASMNWHDGYDHGAFLASAHLAVGAILLGTSVVWTLRAYRTR